MSKSYSFGEKLRLYRRYYGYRQIDVAKFLGVTDALVSYWESNSRQPQIRELSKLASLFHATVDELTNDTKPIYRRIREEETIIDKSIMDLAHAIDEQFNSSGSKQTESIE